MTKTKSNISLLAAAPIFGSVSNPTNIAGNSSGSGLFIFLGYIIKLVGTLAGIFMIVQFIIAGYTYISANGDEKKTILAWNMIWQSILGLVIIASAFVLASVITRITGIQILSPIIYGPI
jgi:hypothetical protein